MPQKRKVEGPRLGGQCALPAGSGAGHGVGELAIDANSLGTIQNPGSPSGRLESFPVQGVFGWRLSPQPGLGTEAHSVPLRW